MVAFRSLAIRNGDVLLLVGTTKGLFVLRSNGARQRWERGGPHHPGMPIYAAALEQRGGAHRLFAGGGTDFWGPLFNWSDDFGKTWADPEKNLIRFPEDTGAALVRIWQIRAGREPGTLFAGVEPTALFESRDHGESWSLVRGLWDHPHRERWEPGAGGKCLHTVLIDPANDRRITIACSTGGVYRTDDGGATWSARNQGVRAEFQPDKYPEFGQCVHKIVHHRSRPERLFLQNHWGLYRSDDAGDSWKDIAKGVPSDFGFCMAMHPHDPDTVYIVPLEADTFRCTPEGKLRVYRTRDAGGSWEALTRGLPQKDALETVLRDAMDTDTMNPAGVYFGTRSGTVWGSANGGAAWTAVTTGLPPVLCVRAVVIGQTPKPRAARSRAAKPRAHRTPSKAAAAPRATRSHRKAAGAGARKRTSRGKAVRRRR